MTARAIAFALTLAIALPAAAEEPFFSYHLRKHPEQKRGLYWRPILSFLIPGLDQWMEEQYSSALVYSGYATVGIGVAFSALDPDNPENNKFKDSLSDRTRRWQWGNQAYMDAGFVSAFHSFRKAAETKKADGKFLFLRHEETTGDLLLAPLHFEHLLKPSIFIPLMVVGTIGVLQTNDPHHSSVWRGDDLGFAGATALNAGVGEEAFFRGYMMPMMRESWGSDFWSNTATATVFALAHIGSISVPLPQFALGWYLGWRVQKEEWRLSQSIFLHTWWDVIALSAAFAHERGQSLYVPLIHAEF